MITNALRSRLAVGHEGSDDSWPWTLGDPLAPATWLEYRGADGSVCATAADLAGYGRMLVNGGAGVLAPEGFERMTTPVAEDPDEGTWYGYGLNLRAVEGRRWISHGGAPSATTPRCSAISTPASSPQRSSTARRGRRRSRGTGCAWRPATMSPSPVLTT